MPGNGFHNIPRSFPELQGERGAYEVLEEIGCGGMSRVYRGRHVQSGEIVAIKVISIDNMAEDFRLRLEREPEVQRGAGHENIVRLIESFRQNEEFFLVMEYIDGRSLAQVIHAEGGPLPLERARKYFRQVLRAVDHLHRLGIIHRDIKPSNILIGWDDSVKLADFGIAKFEWEGDRTLTNRGLGTPEYMSPEQIRGKGIDHRTDIYSLGITFYEMLTAHRPYRQRGDTPMSYMELLQEILDAPLPDPRLLHPELPAGLTWWIQRAVAKESRERFADIADMEAGLEQIERANPDATVIPAVLPATELNTIGEGKAGRNGSPITPGYRQIAAGARSGGGRSFGASFAMMPGWFRRFRVPILVAVAVIAGVLALRPFSGVSQAGPAPPSDVVAAAIVGQIAGRYEEYAGACREDSLARLYAPNDVVYAGAVDNPDTMKYAGEYPGAARITREQLLPLLAAPCADGAEYRHFEVDVETVRVLGAQTLESNWIVNSERRGTDGIIIRDSTADLVRMELLDGEWLITSHMRQPQGGDTIRPAPRRGSTGQVKSQPSKPKVAERAREVVRDAGKDVKNPKAKGKKQKNPKPRKEKGSDKGDKDD